METLQLLLDFRALTSMYRGIPSIQDYFFTKEWFDALSPRDVDSENVELIQVSATTTPGPGNLRGQPARRIANKGGTKRFFQLLRYFTEMEIDGDALKALREPESFGLQEKGKQAVELQMEEQKIKHDLFKEVCLANIMTVGRINLDANGNILTPSVNSSTGVITNATGTVVSADFGVADANRGALTLSGSSIIDALWSTSSTVISAQLDNLRRRAGVLGAPRPQHVYVNAVKKQKLRANTEFNDWAKYNSKRVDDVLANDGIDGLWGYNWHFVDGTWTDASGTTRDLIPQTSVVITPEKGAWIRAHKGSELVPRDLTLATDPVQLLNQLEKVYGEFAYASLSHNPVKLLGYFGDNFGLNFADPNAIFMPTVFA